MNNNQNRFAPLAALLAAFAAPLTAQRLIGIDDGMDTGPAIDVQIHSIDFKLCDVPSSCTPAAAGVIHSIYGQDGGIAFDRRDNSRWFTAGPTLHHVDGLCGAICQWVIPGNHWTGLAMKAPAGRLFFTTAGGMIGEIPTPTAPCGALMSLAPAIYTAAVPPMLVGTLTGVEYDSSTDRLWVIDLAGNVVNIDRPSVGSTVYAAFNISGLCGGFVGSPEGIAFAPDRTAPGHPPGVLFISDAATGLLKVDVLGAFIGCCNVTGLDPALAGLAYRPARHSATYGSGSATGGLTAPSIGETGSPAIGTTSYGLELTEGPTGGVSLMLVGFGPLSASVGGLTLLVSPLATLGPQTLVGQGASDGRAVFVLPLPPDPALREAMVFAQGVAVAGSGAMAMTPGLAIQID